jgi:thioredoxin 1
MNKKISLKIIALLSISAVVLGIWIVKNVDRSSESPDVLDENFRLEDSLVDLDVLTSYGLPLILDFGADACDPCKRMAPVLIKLNAEMQGKAIIKFIDVWKHNGAADGFPVQVIPTQIFITSDGTPYVPSKDLGIAFKYFTHNETKEHIFTVHEGGLTEDQLRKILEDLGVS